MRRATAVALAVLMGALAGSALIGRQLGARGPGAVDLAAPPAPAVLRWQTLGDGQASFRAHALRLQHLGNLGGRIVPYKDIDYDRVASWSRTLDRLDARADVVPAMAALLYSGTQTPADLRPLVRYLADHVRRAPGRKWRWMTHAIYLARYRLEDDALALRLARELRGFDTPRIPGWARHLEILVLRDIGRTQAARALVERLLREADDLAPAERRWLRFYLERQLQ